MERSSTPQHGDQRGAKFSSVEDKYKKQEIARKLEIKRKNVECILKSANVTPFMWYKGRYRCFYCTEPMKNPETLREHTSKIHQFANIETVVCKRVKSNRDKDAAVKIDIRDLACRICAKTLTNLDQFVNHIIIAHDAEYDMSVPNCLLPFRLDKDNPSCATCNMKFIFFEYLLRHANKNHLSHDYMCDICGTSFQGENHMKMHNRYYHREGGYNCEYCDVSFVTLSKKIQHEKNVHLVNLSTCPHCPETFKSPYFKKLHLANVHGVEEMRFECRYCRKVYPQESIMSRHMRRVHLREKNVECSVCGDKFFSAYEVKLHMVKHNGEKKFVCSHCGKRCTTKSNLNAHLLSHSTIKRYRCEICLTAFTHQSNLKYHLKQKHFRTDVKINNEEDDVESDAAKLGVPDHSELDKEEFIEMELVDDNFNGTEDLNQYINID